MDNIVTISELKKYIRFKKIEDIDIDLVPLIVSDEFHRKEAYKGEISEGYRERAIKQLIKLRIHWYTEGNIDYAVAGKYIFVTCPYCGDIMEWNGTTGRMYVCNCGAVANIPTEGIRFDPPKGGKNE